MSTANVKADILDGPNAIDPTTTDDIEDRDEEENLHGTSSRSRRWPLYYLGVSGIASMLLASSALDVPLVVGLSDITLTVVVLAMYWLVVTAHLFDEEIAAVSDSNDQ